MATKTIEDTALRRPWDTSGPITETVRPTTRDREVTRSTTSVALNILSAATSGRCIGRGTLLTTTAMATPTRHMSPATAEAVTATATTAIAATATVVTATVAMATATAVTATAAADMSPAAAATAAAIAVMAAVT